jgi:hypothetical protein
MEAINSSEMSVTVYQTTQCNIPGDSHFYNNIWWSTIFIKLIWNKELPHQWKESVVVPIHKKGDKTDCSNY